MKAGTRLETERLTLRHWTEDDLEQLYRLNSDEQVMRFFPFRRTREQTVELLALLHQRIEEDGCGWAALCLKDNKRPIGFAGLAVCHMEPIPKGSVEIGWRLLPEYWGRGYATEAAIALLDHGFNDLNLPEIIAFAVHDNHQSLAVMKRLGMRRDHRMDFHHPNVPDSQPQLKLHHVYRKKATAHCKN